MSMKKNLLTALIGYYDHDLTPEGLQLYLMMLSEYSDDQVKQGTFKAMKTEKRFPVFATLKSYIEQDQTAELEDSAHRQAQYVKASLAQGQRPDFEDPITARIMSLYLPFSDWKGRPVEDLSKFFIPQFVKKYKHISSDDGEKKKVSQDRALKAPAVKKKAVAPKIPTDEAERENLRALNANWLKDQEDMNLRGLRLMRHGDAGTYPTLEGKGDVLLFCDQNFQARLKSNHDFQAEFSEWDFSGAKKQNLGPVVLSEDEARDAIAKIRAKLGASSAANNKSDRLATSRF